MSWQISNHELCPDALLNAESIFALGNGYLGVRGNFEEGYAEGMDSIRGTYLNAFHDIIPIAYGEKLYGFPDSQQKLVNGIDAQQVTLLFGEDREEFSLFTGTIIDYKRHLHLDKGYSERSIHWRSPAGKEVKLIFRRLVSFSVRELFVIHVMIEPVNFTGRLEISSKVNGAVRNYTASNDPRVASGHAKLLSVIQCGVQEDYSYVVDRTTESGLEMACVTRYDCSGQPAVHIEEGEKEVQYTAVLTLEQPVHFTKWNIYTDTLRHEDRLTECGIELHKQLQKSGSTFDEVAAWQQRYMDQFWYSSDIRIDNDSSLQEGIRFNMYQLLQSAGRDRHSNISAKGLTGEGYEGHYFWDTEIYMIPVFLMNQPEIAKQLLIYRYSILDHARARAREMGHTKGALFPWRTISGSECSSFFPSGTAQYHISADIAYSYIQYYLATGDRDFLLHYGAELLFETARLWVEIGHYVEQSFHIDEVTGPDEYTCCVNNNYYTNVMAKHNLEWAARSYEIVKGYDGSGHTDLCRRLNVTEEEVQGWRTAAEAMYLPYDDHLGINPQDDTFLSKKVWDFNNTPQENYPLLLHYHPLTIYRFQVCKQADTVLAHFLLEDEQDLDTIRRSYDYYESVTTHDSSLSSCIFSIMASKVGYEHKAYHYFTETARLDLDNTHGNTKDGLHLANMGGTWMAIVYGFAGVRLKPSGLSIAPAIPQSWNRYQFRIRYLSRFIEFHIDADHVEIKLLEGDNLLIKVYDQEIQLTNDETVKLPISAN